MLFNEMLETVNLQVMTQFPNAAFYEAQGILVPNEEGDIDGTIRGETFLAAYCLKGVNQTIIATLNEDGTTTITKHASPWVEDRVMTPYVPLMAEDAIKLVEDKLGKNTIKPEIMALRFQLFPGEIEPRYFFGTFGNDHTVGVYSLKIDEQVKPVNKKTKPNNEDFYNFYF